MVLTKNQAPATVEQSVNLLEFVIYELAKIRETRAQVRSKGVEHTIAISDTKCIFVKDQELVTYFDKISKYPLLSKITTHFQNMPELIVVLGKTCVNIDTQSFEFKSIVAIKDSKKPKVHKGFYPNTIRVYIKDTTDCVTIMAIPSLLYKEKHINTLNKIFVNAVPTEYSENDVILHYLSVDDAAIANFTEFICEFEALTEALLIQKMVQKEAAVKEATPTTAWQQRLAVKKKIIS